jgi:hypothetical protein
VGRGVLLNTCLFWREITKLKGYLSELRSGLISRELERKLQFLQNSHGVFVTRIFTTTDEFRVYNED